MWPATDAAYPISLSMESFSVSVLYRNLYRYLNVQLKRVKERINGFTIIQFEYETDERWESRELIEADWHWLLLLTTTTHTCTLYKYEYWLDTEIRRRVVWRARKMVCRWHVLQLNDTDERYCNGSRPRTPRGAFCVTCNKLKNLLGFGGRAYIVRVWCKWKSVHVSPKLSLLQALFLIIYLSIALT